MKFDPKDANQLIPDGEYDAQIETAEETQSKSKNPMLKLTVKVWAVGNVHHIWDYIVVPAMAWKLKQLCGLVGMMPEFESGSIEAASLEGKTVRVFIKTQADKTGQYPDRNVIAKYVQGDASAAAESTPPGDDDIPF